MNTIRLGEVFCSRYNVENHTGFTPKEIFVNVLAPLIFKKHKQKIFWRNSVFDPKYLFCGRQMEEIGLPKFKEIEFTEENIGKINQYLDKIWVDKINEFCTKVEQDSPRMSSVQMWGGCAQDIDTSSFAIGDNNYFNIDERYCSFIGAFFTIMYEGFSIIINNSDLVWKLYQGFDKYETVLEEITTLKGNQLPVWNTLYLIYGDDITTKVLSDVTDALTTKQITLMQLVKGIFIPYNVQVFELNSMGQTNVTCGALTFDLEEVRRDYEIIDQLFVDFGNAEFNQMEFFNTFQNKSTMRYFIERGGIMKDTFNPLRMDFDAIKEIEKIKKNKYINIYKEYLKMVLKQDVKDLSASLSEFLNACIQNKKLRQESNVSALFDKSSNQRIFVERLADYLKKMGCDMNWGNDILAKIINMNGFDYRMFILFTKFNTKF